LPTLTDVFERKWDKRLIMGDKPIYEYESCFLDLFKNNFSGQMSIAQFPGNIPEILDL